MITWADNAAGVQERCRASSHCSAHRHDRSASCLATLQWTFFIREEDEVDSMFRKQCCFWDTVYSMTDKTQFHVSPGSAETLVRRGGITNQFDSILPQQHVCQKLTKLVDMRRSYSVLHQCRFFDRVGIGIAGILQLWKLMLWGCSEDGNKRSWDSHGDGS